MQRRAMLSLVAASVLFAEGLAFGSEPPRVAPGSRVRIDSTIPGPRLTGRLVGLDQQSLTISVDGLSRAIPRDQIRRLEVSRGRPSRWRRAVVGAGIGAVSGVPAAAFTGEWHITGPLALYGAVIGFCLPAHEKWTVVDVRGVQARLSPSAEGGPGIVLTVSF